MTIPAGLRDTYITIWKESATTPDATGQIVPSYTKKCNAWARFTTVAATPNSATLKAAKESWIGSRVNADALWVVTIPYIEGIETTDRVSEVDRGTTYTYEIAGPPFSDGGDLIFPVAEVV